MPNARTFMFAGGIYAFLFAVICSGPASVGSIRTPEEEVPLVLQESTTVTTSSACPLAAPYQDSRNTFVIDAVLFQDLSLWQDWILREGAGCDGAPVGLALLTPAIDPVNPTKNSHVLITINETLDTGPTLSLCASEPAGRCAAKLRIRERPRRVVDLFSGVLSSKTVRAFHSLHPNLALLFEVLLAVALVVVMCTVTWFIYLAYSAFKAPEQVWGLTESEDLSDRHLKLPNPSDIISQGLIDVLFFVIGCGLFVLEGERLFRAYHDPTGVGYILVLSFPLLFGCFAVLRIFLATARCHLYYESLRNGILIKYTVSSSWISDPLVLWFWLGIIITLSAAVKVVYCEQSSLLSDLQALVVFASPIYYMTSSIMDIQYAEKTALHSECILGLEGVCKEEPVTIGEKNNIVPVHESVFVSLARNQDAINSTSSRQSQGSSDCLGVTDLRWVAAVSRRKATGLNRLFLLLFDPTLICTLLCLAIICCAVCFRKITTKPEMLQLQVIGGTLATGFSPQLKDYSVFLERTQSFIAISGQVDAAETTRFSMLNPLHPGIEEENTTGSSLTQALTLNSQDTYPVKRTFVVADSTSKSDYRLQMLKTGFLPSRLKFVAQTERGVTFSRCVPWGYLWQAVPIALPTDTKSLTVEMEVLHYVSDIPSKRRLNDRFSTVFYPNMSQEECGRYLTYRASVTSWHAESGCWVVLQPYWADCEITRSDLTSQFLKYTESHLGGTACAKSNGMVEKGCIPFQQPDGNNPHLIANVTGFLPKISYGDLSSFSADLLVYEGNSTTSYSAMTVGDWYNARQGIFLSYKESSNWDVMAVGVLSDAVPVWSNGFAMEFRTERGWDVKPWQIWLYDSPGFAKADNLTLIFVSSDIDCSIVDVQAKSLSGQQNGSVSLTKIPTPVGACTWDQESEVCELGWKRTAAFVLPLDQFKEWCLQSNFKELDLMGLRKCDSMQGFQDRLGTEPLLVTTKLIISPNVKAVPFMPLEPEKPLEFEYECVDEDGCHLNVHHMNHFSEETGSLDMPMIGLVYRLDHNCSMELSYLGEHVTGELMNDTVQDYHFRPGQLAAICSYPVMKDTKLCGGSHDTIAFQFRAARQWSHTSETEVVTRYHCGWFTTPNANVILTLVNN